jgi:hypothetical protein
MKIYQGIPAGIVLRREDRWGLGKDIVSLSRITNVSRVRNGISEHGAGLE